MRDQLTDELINNAVFTPNEDTYEYEIIKKRIKPDHRDLKTLGPLELDDLTADRQLQEQIDEWKEQPRKAPDSIWMHNKEDLKQKLLNHRSAAWPSSLAALLAQHCASGVSLRKVG